MEEWTQIHEQYLLEGSGKVDTDIQREDMNTLRVLIGGQSS